MTLNCNIKHFVGQINKSDFNSYVIGVDIGGTNTNIGIAGVTDKKTQFWHGDFLGNHRHCYNVSNSHNRRINTCPTWNNPRRNHQCSGLNNEPFTTCITTHRHCSITCI